MKVLFAINNEDTVNQIINYYKDTYSEKIEATKVYFFRSLVDTLKKNKNFDRIIIHEELEPVSVKNQDVIDKFLLKNIDSVSDEAGRADIIFICAGRRQITDKLLKNIFNLGTYNILLGPDRTVGKVCELINRPRTKKDAKRFMEVDIEDDVYESVDKVDEIELRHIITYYEKNIFDETKIVSGFEGLYNQYTFEKLKQIITFLPVRAREILETKSDKYVALMRYTPQKGSKSHREVKVVEVPVYIQEMPKPVRETVEEAKPESVNEQKKDENTVTNEVKYENIPSVEPEIELPKPKIETIIEKEPELPKIEPVAQEEPELPKVEPVAQEELELPKVEPVAQEEPELPKVEHVSQDEPELPKVEHVVQEPELPKIEPIVQEKPELPKVEPIAQEEPELPKVEHVSQDEPKLVRPQKYTTGTSVNTSVERTDNSGTPSPRYQPPRPVMSEPQIQTVTQVIEKEVKVYETPKDYKKVVCFIGAHKTGSTFIINTIASVLASKGVKTAILDLTKNKDSYLVYAANDEESKEIAGNSLNNLAVGLNKPLEIGNLRIYTGIPRSDRTKYDAYKIIEMVKRENSVVLIDCDFVTPLEVFRYVQNIYVVQDMDALNILPITMFLKELKNHDVDLSKVAVIVNKYVKCALTATRIVESLAYYSNPEMTIYEELLPKNVKRFIIPFDEQNYLRYIENLYTSKMNFSGFSDEFKQSVAAIIQDVFPIGSGASPRMAEESSFIKNIFKKK